MGEDQQSGIGQALSLGIELTVGVGLGLLIGHWLDRRYGWEPWATVIGSMLGLCGGLYLVLKQTMQMNKS